MQMYKIYIVEDDNVISNEIKKHICSWGNDAKCAERFNNILEEFINYSPDLVILDITLPFFDGYYWCKKIREISNIPILFLSSASDNMNIIMAINMGGDDFISKPFDLDVLTAKIQALLRRSYNLTDNTNVMVYNDILLNISDASLSYNNEKIDLTKNELKILSLLLQHKNNIVKRDTIMEKLWQTDSYVDENTLTVNIARLRKKLDKIGINNFILTKKGLGYMVK